ncbi:hypothetical protein L915_17449 [Phytophthora nicotianae]|uniref:Uncharacterized protein n=1 Tax=Phytophthora nicotianae TaxID=4792 RepID=W2G1A2_PHYNI|nr:hypothetical protein L915_17449 [Phytophthora nicotianae]
MPFMKSGTELEEQSIVQDTTHVREEDRAMLNPTRC